MLRQCQQCKQFFDGATIQKFCLTCKPKFVQHTFYKNDYDPRKVKCSAGYIKSGYAKTEEVNKKKEERDMWIKRCDAMIKKHPTFNFIRILKKQIEDPKHFYYEENKEKRLKYQKEYNEKNKVPTIKELMENGI